MNRNRNNFWIGMITEILFIVSLLILSFWIAIYGDQRYRFYEKEYEKYQVDRHLNMEMDDVMDVTEYMMDYLIGKESALSIEVDVDGKYQDFFNEQDRLHMADVKKLFLRGVKLGRFLTIIVILCWIYLFKKKGFTLREKFRSYGCALGVFLVIVLFLAIAFYVDFTKCFTIFHHIFFSNDLWLFDPATDYMIRMLPEGFFADMCIRIVCTFLGILCGYGILLSIGCLKRRNRSKTYE